MAKNKRTNNAKQKTTQKNKDWAIYKCCPILDYVDVTSSLLLQDQPAGLENK